MGNKRRSEIVFKVAGFSESANEVLSKAVKFACDEECMEINLIHLFLALLDTTKQGQNLLKSLNTTFEDMYEAYSGLANNGEFGTGEMTVGYKFPFQYFTKDLFQLLSMISHECMNENREMSAEALFEFLLDFESEELRAFLEYIGLDYESIEESRYKEFFIPDELTGYIEDLNTTVLNNKMTIKNVDNYIDEMIEVLSRKLKANPCLIGEAGVGKTTVVNGLVQRIVNGDVPESLKDTHVVFINGALLTSGTKYRGEFEERMKAIIEWASKSNVILFLDEIHTFINCGKNGENSADTAGNMIKRPLSDGSIKIIGTTTLKEYHKYIEVDSAFSRRLQSIIIKEPSVDMAIEMIKDTIIDYEEFHNIKISEDVIELAVKLSHRYMKDKFLPDKAYTILDQASARVKLKGKYKTVKENDILEVVSKITGVNINKLGREESKQLINLENTISKNVIGQKNAISTVSKAIRRAKAGVRDENKPLASFLFVGPTGVGKTELCKVLSNEVAVGDAKLIKIDMSEYSEKHSISKLIGTAPGYVGYGEGGQLTEKVKHNPYSIILFDEIEKAHPEVFNIFLQLLDEGKLTDSEGQTVDFTNCVVVLTSNAGYGADGMNKGKLGFGASNDERDDVREKEKIAIKALESTFKPEFLNRLDNIVIFEKLNKEQCESITKLLLDKLSDRLKEKGITIKFSKSIIDRLVDKGYSDKYGARNLRREIQDTVEDVLADAILDGTLVKNNTATVSWKDNKVKLKVDNK